MLFRWAQWLQGAYVAGTLTITLSFVDVTPDNWAYGAIEQLRQRCSTQGLYQDAQGWHYRPTAPVSRAQLAVFIIRAWP